MDINQLIEFANNNILLVGIWIVLVIAIIYTFVSGAMSPVKELSTHEATLLINRQDAVILDVRALKEFKAGHIIDARQLKTEEIRDADFSKLEKNKSKPIIVVCAMGTTSKKTASQLLKNGFENVSILKGGMNAWQSASLPTHK